MIGSKISGDVISFRIAKQEGGKGHFADLGLKLAAGNTGEIFWPNDLSHPKIVYGEIIRAGIYDALQWHMESGGESAAFLICEFIPFWTDLTPDALRCAATGASWRALGHEDTELVFEFDDGWKVRRA